MSLLISTQSYQIRVSLFWLHLTLITSLKFLSHDTVTMGVTSTYEFGGDPNIQSIINETLIWWDKWPCKKCMPSIPISKLPPYAQRKGHVRTKYTSANQRAQQKPSWLELDFRCLASSTVRRLISVVWITHSMIFCYGRATYDIKTYSNIHL